MADRVEKVYRFKRLVGGPADGETVADAAFEQPMPKGLTVLRHGGRTLYEMPPDALVDVVEYHARLINVGDRVVEAFIHDQIAYDGATYDRLLGWIVKVACDQ